MVLAHNVNEVERTEDINIAVEVTFESMLLAAKTLAGLKQSGFYKPSPIQLHGIPLGKCGFDLILEAKSGTGKTAVFTVIALEKLDIHIGLQSIILAPTREIAAQICDVIKQIGSMYKDLNVEVIMGGLPIEEDIKKFQKNVHILVGSPGRMRHLIQGNHVNISAVRLFVLDEADKLMDKNFQSDINYIFSVLPKQKQVIMSSATYPDSLKSIMQNYVHNAQHICPDSTAILLGIKQLVTIVQSHPNIVRQTQIKFNELIKILTQQEFKQCLIFCNYQIRVVELCKMLLSAKWPAEQLHGQLEQTDRLDALKTLQNYKCRILVSTDLAARGIDASNVDLVINFESPYEWQTYLHRMGRAGRFGSYGKTISILSEGKETSKFKAMIRNINSFLSLDYVWDSKKFELIDSDSSCTSLEPESESLQEGSPSSLHNTQEIVDVCIESNQTSLKLEDDALEQACNGMKCGMTDAYTVSECTSLENDISEEELPTQEIADVCREEDNLEVSKQILEAHCQKYEVNIKNSMFLDDIEKAEFQIESFDDLLESLKHHELNDIKENGTENINFTCYYNSTLNMSSKPKPIIVDQTNKSINVLEILSQTNGAENLKNTTPKLDEISESEKHASENMNATKEDKIKSDIIGFNALKEAGLPTSFGSTKHNNKSQIKPCRPHTEDISNKQKSNMYNKGLINQKSNNFSKEKHFRNDIEIKPLYVDENNYKTQSLQRVKNHVPSQDIRNNNSNLRKIGRAHV